MSRVRRGPKARRRRNKILKLAKGFHFSRRQHYKCAAETVERALHFRYKSRRLLKRDRRQLWVVRISAAIKSLGGSYSKWMAALKEKKIELNRKMLSEIAARDFPAFETLYNVVGGK